MSFSALRAASPLEEKGVPYRLVPLDVSAEGGTPPDHLVRHSFGRIPAFEHRGFHSCETGAATRCLDTAAPALTVR